MTLRGLPLILNGLLCGVGLGVVALAAWFELVPRLADAISRAWPAAWP